MYFLAPAKSGVAAEQGEDEARQTKKWASLLSAKHFHNIPSFQPKADSVVAACTGGKSPGVKPRVEVPPAQLCDLGEATGRL